MGVFLVFSGVLGRFCLFAVASDSCVVASASSILGIPNGFQLLSVAPGRAWQFLFSLIGLVASDELWRY